MPERSIDNAEVLRLIAPPPRLGRRGAALVVLLLGCFAAFPFGALPALLVVTIALTAAAADWKERPAAALGLLLGLTLLALLIPGLNKLWPLPVLVALTAHWTIFRVVGSDAPGWLRRGRLGRGEWLLIAGCALVSGLALALWLMLLDPDVTDLVARLPRWPWPALLALGLAFSCANALAEEALYRGALLHALDAALGPGRAALILQAAAFGLLHINGFPRRWFGVLLAFVYGLMTGAIRRRSRGLLAPWLAHVCADLTIFALLWLSI